MSPPGPTVSFSSLAEPRADLWTLQATVLKAPLVYRSPTELGLASVAVGSVTKHAPASKAIGTKPLLVYRRPTELGLASEAVGS